MSDAFVGLLLILRKYMVKKKKSKILIFNCVMHYDPPTAIPAFKQKLSIICATSTRCHI
jgi:hypothetical protein